MFSDSDAPKVKPAGSSKGLSVDAVGELLAVIVPGVTVEPVTELLLQHKSTVLVTLVSGSVGGLNDDVYNAVHFTSRTFDN